MARHTMMRNRIGMVANGTLAAVLTLPFVASCTSAATPDVPTAPAVPGKPGAAGAGDPYFPKYGNGGYDVATYDIKVDYDPATQSLTGTTAIAARASQNLSTFNLDLALKASAATVNGVSAGVNQDKTELTIRPKKTLPAGASFTVTVKYAGIPANSRIPATENPGWQRTPTGAIALGQPESAVLWYPSNDHPRDKATFTVSATVPAGRQAISNGLPAANRSAAGGAKTTWTWTDPTPKATYQAFLAVGSYDISTNPSPLGKPNIIAVERGAPNAAYLKKTLARTGNIVDWLVKQYGTFPFNSTGGVMPASGVDFALETPTRPVYDPRPWADGENNDDLLVHENAHHWFGDSVSVNNWKDIWLNEGFATFSSWLWSEQHGEGSARDMFDALYESRPASHPSWKIRIADPGVAKLFDYPRIYQSGAMTLQALRNRMGDPKFFQLLRTWAATRAGGNGRIEDFTALASHIAGQNLTAFFQNWLYTPARPAPTPENGFR